MPQNSDTKEVFLQAYEQYADAIFRHCYFRVYDRETAKDLSQECFTKVWDYTAKGKRIDNMQAFLYRVANNLVIDHVRRAKADSLDSMTENGFEPESHDCDLAEITAESGLAMGALQKLDDQHRDVIVMRFIDGLSPKEIAKALKTSENVVSVRLHRALAKLRLHII